MGGDGGFYDGWAGKKMLQQRDPALVRKEKGHKYSLTTQVNWVQEQKLCQVPTVYVTGAMFTTYVLINNGGEILTMNDAFGVWKTQQSNMWVG